MIGRNEIEEIDDQRIQQISKNIKKSQIIYNINS